MRYDSDDDCLANIVNRIHHAIFTDPDAMKVQLTRQLHRPGWPGMAANASTLALIRLRIVRSSFSIDLAPTEVKVTEYGTSHP